MTAPFCPECGPTCPLHSTTAFLDPLHDELDRLRTEVARYVEGADDTDPPENVRRTARQAWHTLLNLPAEDRMQRLDALLDDAYDCDRFAARLAQAEARVDQLTDQLTLANDTLRRRGMAVNATGHTNDQLRATIARIEKLCATAAATTSAVLVWDLRAALDSQEPARD